MKPRQLLRLTQQPELPHINQNRSDHTNDRQSQATCDFRTCFWLVHQPSFQRNKNAMKMPTQNWWQKQTKQIAVTCDWDNIDRCSENLPAETDWLQCQAAPWRRAAAWPVSTVCTVLVAMSDLLERTANTCAQAMWMLPARITGAHRSAEQSVRSSLGLAASLHSCTVRSYFSNMYALFELRPVEKNRTKGGSRHKTTTNCNIKRKIKTQKIYSLQFWPTYLDNQ